MSRVLSWSVVTASLLLFASCPGCSWVIQGATDDPSTVLDWDGVCRADVEKRLGTAVRSEPGSAGTTICDYRYTYKPGNAFALDNMLTKKRVWGGPGSVVVRVLAEPFMTVAAVADKQNDRLPGDATVAYDREGRLVWWVGTRSDAARRAKSGEQTP